MPAIVKQIGWFIRLRQREIVGHNSDYNACYNADQIEENEVHSPMW